MTHCVNINGLLPVSSKLELVFTLPCTGNARWAPAVSEYRQANPKYPLQHAAESMVTTVPPAETGDLLEATAQLTTMGRYACTQP